MTIEINEGRGCGPNKDHILLHLEHLGAELLHERLPGISETAKVFAGVDVTKEPIPVLPTVHYNMGGIPTNYHGEVLRGDRGRPGRDRARPDGGRRGGLRVGARRQPARHQLAARPGGVRPRRGAPGRRDAQAGRLARRRCRPRPGEAALDRLRPRAATRTAAPGSAQLRPELQRTMQSHAAVFRNSESLQGGRGEDARVWGGAGDMAVTDRSLIWNSDLVEALEFQNLIGNAMATMAGAEARHESRGAQAHDDYPERDDANWMKHTLAWCDADGAVRLDYRPVKMQTLTNEVRLPAEEAGVLTQDGKTRHDGRVYAAEEQPRRHGQDLQGAAGRQARASLQDLSLEPGRRAEPAHRHATRSTSTRAARWSSTRSSRSRTRSIRR